MRVRRALKRKHFAANISVIHCKYLCRATWTLTWFMPPLGRLGICLGWHQNGWQSFVPAKFVRLFLSDYKYLKEKRPRK